MYNNLHDIKLAVAVRNQDPIILETVAFTMETKRCNFAETFMKWAPDEPNDHGGGEDCGALLFSSEDYGHWNDYSCVNKIKTICEKGNYNTILIHTAHRLEMGNTPNSNSLDYYTLHGGD